MKVLYYKNRMLLAAVIAMYGAGLFNTIADPDMWGYLAFGYLFWTKPGFPYHDPFSYMPTHATWVYHEWLTGVFFFPLYGGLGPAALQAVRYAAAVATLWLVYRTAVKRGARPWTAILGLFFTACAICPGYAPVRAHIFTFLFFALTLHTAETARKDNSFRRLWLLPPVYMVWCNLHGGFVAGLGILGLYCLGEALSRKRFLPFVLIAVLCTLATLVNPYGLDYWAYLLDALTMSRSEISEWLSLWQAARIGRETMAIFVFLGLAGFTLLLAAVLYKKDKTALLILLASGWMAFSHVRHLVLFGLASAALAPSVATAVIYSARPGENVRRVWGLSNALWVPAAWLALVHCLALAGLAATFDASRSPLSLQVLPPAMAPPGEMSYPTGGFRFLEQNSFSGNLLSEFDWGEFLLWSLPQCKVAMDGRYETVYPEEICRQYFDFRAGKPGWERYLQDYPHEIALFPPRSTARMLLANSPEWTLVFEDGSSVVFVRDKKG